MAGGTEDGSRVGRWFLEVPPIKFRIITSPTPEVGEVEVFEQTTAQHRGGPPNSQATQVFLRCTAPALPQLHLRFDVCARASSHHVMCQGVSLCALHTGLQEAGVVSRRRRDHPEPYPFFFLPTAYKRIPADAGICSSVCEGMALDGWFERNPAIASSHCMWRKRLFKRCVSLWTPL